MFVADPKHTCVPVSSALIRQALDALDVRIGTAHIEVIMTAQGPKLVEYNGRWV